MSRQCGLEPCSLLYLQTWRREGDVVPHHHVHLRLGGEKKGHGLTNSHNYVCPADVLQCNCLQPGRPAELDITVTLLLTPAGIKQGPFAVEDQQPSFKFL